MNNVEPILQALVSVLSIVGLITAPEGADLVTYGIMSTTGLIGLVCTARAIIKRRKAEKAEKTDA